MTIVPRTGRDAPRILVAPHPPRPTLRAAIERNGGRIVTDPAGAEALIWLDPHDPSPLAPLLDAGPDIRWIQLPFAGIDPFLGHLDPTRVWTSGKGVYADPVAEMVLGMLLAGMRNLVSYARASTWSAGVGRNLFDAHVVVLGAGGITGALLPLLEPFRCRTTVVRRRREPFPGAHRTTTLDDLRTVVVDADALVIALALTTETDRVVDAAVLAAMPPHALLVNVGRGRHVDTDALVTALAQRRLGGAALDVTEPEPLPDGHPLWSEPRCLITPHTGNTPEMGRVLLEARIGENIARFADGRPLIGTVDPSAGY